VQGKITLLQPADSTRLAHWYRLSDYCQSLLSQHIHHIIGICGIDIETMPFFWKMTTSTNDANTFAEFITEAVVSGFLKENDVLVLDNAAIHRGGENEFLSEWLWNHVCPGTTRPLHILVVYLPTRAPELNPIELLWAVLVKRLKSVPLVEGTLECHACANAAADIMTNFTHYLVASCYVHCELMAR
jgi:hypothetical protein